MEQKKESMTNRERIEFIKEKFGIKSYGNDYLIFYKGTNYFRPPFRSNTNLVQRSPQPYRPGRQVKAHRLSKSQSYCAAGIHFCCTPQHAETWGSTVVQILVKPQHLWIAPSQIEKWNPKLRAKEVIVDCVMERNKWRHWVVDKRYGRLKYGWPKK